MPNWPTKSPISANKQLEQDQSDIKQLNYKRSSQWIKKATSSKRSERFSSKSVAKENPMKPAELTFLPAWSMPQKLHLSKKKN